MTNITSEKDLLAFLSAETREQAKRHVYKYTDCGAWIEFDDKGIRLGSIVEGSDADVSADPLIYPFTGKDYDDAMDYIESETSVLWKEANEGEQ